MQLTDKQKYEIVILREQNNKIDTIADKMNVNRKTVMRWLNKYNKDNNICRKEGSGRKNITSNKQDNKIIDIIINENDLTIHEINVKLQKKNFFI